MKHFQLSLLFVAACMASCNNTSTDTVAPAAAKDSTVADTSSKPAEVKIMVPNTACYAYQKGKDTITLKTEHFPNVVTGMLLYKLSGKDSNKGDIDGVLHGDTLIADYKFMSEGKLSTRQVAFILKDSTATEGYGPSEEKEGKMIFKNTSKLDFSKSLKLKQVPCPLQ